MFLDCDINAFDGRQFIRDSQENHAKAIHRYVFNSVFLHRIKRQTAVFQSSKLCNYNWQILFLLKILNNILICNNLKKNTVQTK